MALTGQLSDLSLAELIEFFCNQRKTGRLKVAFERTPGYFYFERGDLVDAKIGSLNGVEAIYYALTLANASFKFSPAFEEPPRRTIHQPWTQVTLEGLRRLDEGIKPKAPVAKVDPSHLEDPDGVNESAAEIEDKSDSALPLSLMVDNAASGGRSKMIVAAVVLAVVALVAVIGIPAGWYSKGQSPAPVQTIAPEAQTSNAESNNAESAQPESSTSDPNIAEAAPSNDANAALALKRAREAKERARLAEANTAAKQAPAANSPAAPASADAAKKPDAPKSGPKMVSVQVTYDEAGRVTQTSGGDGTAQRIARQKRFPAGKAGTTTVTIPIN
jgi:cytoskeletal protein RodZ